MSTTATKRADAITAAYGSRIGTVKTVIMEGREIPPAAPIVQGLDLSDIFMKPRSFFRLNPANEIFRSKKTEAYYRDLERDIKENGIREPLLTMPDGLILSGESRWILSAPERLNIERLPVRLMLSPLSPEEQERQLLLSNLSRFELDEDTRLYCYMKVWPGYFAGEKVAEKAKVDDIAQATGKSKRQVIRDGQVAREASAKAKEEGREVGVEDIAQARKGRAEARREHSAKTESPAILRVRPILAEMREESERWMKEGLKGALNFARYADMIEEALR